MKQSQKSLIEYLHDFIDDPDNDPFHKKIAKTLLNLLENGTK